MDDGINWEEFLSGKDKDKTLSQKERRKKAFDALVDFLSEDIERHRIRLCKFKRQPVKKIKKETAHLYYNKSKRGWWLDQSVDGESNERSTLTEFHQMSIEGKNETNGKLTNTQV